MVGERARREAERLHLAKWLIAEAAWKAHKLQDGRSVLGQPDVAWTVTGLLQTLALHWHWLPEQVQSEVLNTCGWITNPDRRPDVTPASLRHSW